jgi:protein-L-isoaspartate(D-aspartate) O-methyltransferase
MSASSEELRQTMVATQLVARGIRSPAVIAAFRKVRREDFVPDALAFAAYDDNPLSIGGGQTISQPYIVAVTLEALALRGDERALDVGTGSGYAAALLACLARDVWSIERIQELADSGRDRLARLGFQNVAVVCGDGSLGLPEHAPYDAIAVAASGPKIPRALLDQLTIGGRLVMPVGRDPESQVLVRVTRTGVDSFTEEPQTSVRFVPLIGRDGWSEQR